MGKNGWLMEQEMIHKQLSEVIGGAAMMLAKCIANDEPHYCLKCGAESKIDSRKEEKKCRKCRSKNVISTSSLEGVKCAKCENGHFVIDKGFFCVS
jgi:putative hemolysin